MTSKKGEKIEPMYKSLLDRLANQHESISFIIQNISDEGLEKKPLPGKWSIKDNIAHLAKYQKVFIERKNQILTTDQPFFNRYAAENDNDFESWRQYSMPALLNFINDDRRDIWYSVSNLSAEDLNKIGIHKKFGAMTLIQWTEFFILHEAHHIYTIFQLANDAELKR
jgi:hypothetical protein